jgi:hypothetical protein
MVLAFPKCHQRSGDDDVIFTDILEQKIIDRLQLEFHQELIGFLKEYVYR